MNINVFDWVDFFMNPFHIFMFGCTAGVLAWFFTGGILYTFNVNRKLGIKIMIVVTILAVLAGWGMWVALLLWYNTPLGPPLELIK